jgi:predicted nucleotidyltransferase
VIRYLRDEELEKKIINYLVKKGAKKIEFFGSYVRGEDYNDIDIVVEFEKWPDLFDFIKFKLELEELTNKKIDLLAGRESISKYILPYVINELREVYEK